MRIANRIMPAAAVVAAGAVALAAACGGRQSRLEPAAGARSDGDVAQGQAEGVALQATVDAWPGDPGVLDHVTPLKVTVRNQGDQPLRLQYRYFSVVNQQGKRFAALPPFQIEGTVTEPVLSPDAAPLQPVQPAFRFRGLEIAPFYAAVYRDAKIIVYSDYLDYDMDYYDLHYAYWRMALPTPEMLARVIPEGVLQPGGEAEGFLYFEKVSGDSEHVQLEVELVTADGDQIGLLILPFVVRD